MNASPPATPVDHSPGDHSPGDHSPNARAAIQRLIAGTETLAAVGLALAQHCGDVELPPDFRRGVDAVTRTVLGDLQTLDRTEAKVLGSLARALLAQAAAFSTNPEEPAAWAVTEPVVLQSLGQASAALATGVCDDVVPRYFGLADRLNRDGGAVLDVGTGVGALALAFAARWPNARIVGLDVWEPALRLARHNVGAAGLVERIEIREQDVAELGETDAYDLVWFAGPFIPGTILANALARVARACRPGGVVVYGTFGGLDPLSSALADLRILRSGGPIHDDAQIETLLLDAGLENITFVGTYIGLPARLVCGQRS